MSTPWDQKQAVKLCEDIEAIAPRFGYHVALTGGCLYKAWPNTQRKDLDLIFYCLRSHNDGGWPRLRGDRDGLLRALCEKLNLSIVDNWGPWKKIVHTSDGKSIDMLFPDENC